MRAEVIAIGDELTTGQRLDTNSQWLSERLTELGIQVAFHTTVGDDLDDNVAAFRTAIDRAEIIVVTGGLGPTADDLTREALATATGAELVRNEESLAYIRQLFASRGRSMPARNEVQADFPAGSRPVPNLQGTAPGIEMPIERRNCEPCVLFALPGVPVEMREMWEATVAPQILELQPEPVVIRHRRIKCFGVGESKLETMLPNLLRRDREPRVGITVSDATITLRITASGKDEATCLTAMAPTIATIHDSLGNLVFGQEEDEIEDAVIRLLHERSLTIAVVDWATEGLVVEWLNRADKNTSVLIEGEINQGSPLIEAPRHDPAVAVALAESIRQSTSADIGLAIAAFPPETESPDDQVCVALAMSDRTRKLRFSCAAHPAIVRPRTAKQALNALRLALRGLCDTVLPL